MAINGPGNGMIAVVLPAVVILKTYGDHFFNYLLAAFVISGFIMFLLGFFKMGRFGDNFPSTVVLGLLAGIGIIIFLKQIPSGLGITGENGFDFTHAHLPETLIFIGSVSILIVYEFTKNRLIKFIPGPVWVLFFAIPFVLYFGIKKHHGITLGNQFYEAAPDFFVSIPNSFASLTTFRDFVQAFPTPDFSLINKLDFWFIVLNITLVGTLESLLSAKAVERLDPLERKVNLNKDLIALGIGTMVSGCIGGMPVNNVIARSSININSGGKSSWSNFMAGVFLLLALIFLTDYLNYIPFSALAAVLLVTGFKLSKPKVYKDAWLHGKEQLVILCITLLVTKFYGLITGVVTGMIFNLVVHVFYFDGNPLSFFKLLISPNLKTVDTKENKIFVRLYGILNFLNVQPLEKLLQDIPEKKELTIDFSHLKLVDLTVLEYVQSFAKDYRSLGGKLETVGLGTHYTTSIYPRSLHYLKKDAKQHNNVQRITLRQQRLMALANENNWQFETERIWETPELSSFEYFKHHPVEYTSNVISGNYDDLDITWEISDMTFDEGAFIEIKELHTTEHLVRLPFEVPDFILDQEFLYDRIKDIIVHNDIDLDGYPEFNKKFTLQSSNPEKIKSIFGQDLILFFMTHNVYHVECTNNKLVIFRQDRLASVQEIKEMIDYTHDLCVAIRKYAS